MRKIYLLMALLTAVVQVAWADTWDGTSKSRPTYYSWYGGRTEVVVINTAAELAYAAEHWDDDSGDGVSKDYYEHNYYLNADLDMGDNTNWKPLGFNSKGYCGHFYGNNHTIRIVIKGSDSSQDTNGQGLFEEVKGIGCIQDVHVSGEISLKNARKVGGIAGSIYGKIINCWVSANISTTHYDAMSDAELGGIVGLVSSEGRVEYCCMTGNVSNPKDFAVGGIIGRINGSSKVNHVTFYGTRTNSHRQDDAWCGHRTVKLESKYEDFNQSEYNTAKSNGHDLYAYAIRYPYAVNVNSSGYGKMAANTDRAYPGQLIMLTKTFGDLDLKNINVEGPDSYQCQKDGDNVTVTFPMPKSDVNITVGFSTPAWMNHAGSEGDPYLISSADDWTNFANCINGGDGFSGKYVKLNGNISVTTMVGKDDPNSFQGTFDGNGKTLTFAKGTSESPFSEEYCAPFRHVKNATIKNLHVTGTIYTNAMKAAGVVGESHGALTITNCRSSVAINSSKSDDGTHGGFVATLSGADNTILIDGCIFDGSFATTNGTNNCGGFIGWPVWNTPTIRNSIMKPSSVAEGMLNNTFARWHSTYRPIIAGCYYVATDNLPSDQGIQVYPDVPANEIYSTKTLCDNQTYYIPCRVNTQTDFQYTGNDITINVPIVYDPESPASPNLKNDVDFTYTPKTVKEQGVHNLVITVTANHSKYSGTKTIPIFVGDFNSSTLTTGEYAINSSLIIEDRIPVVGNVVINLGTGVNLHAKKGFEVSEGNSLTINGPGALTIDGCDEKKSGIGAVKVGTIIINGGTINVTGGYRAAALGGDYENTVGGTIIINGGVVNATGGTHGAGIGGGETYNSSKGVCGEIAIYGGQVTVRGGSDAPGIGHGWYYRSSTIRNGTLILGWTNADDFVDCNAYTSDATAHISLSSITFSQQFALDGTTTIANAGNINGKKIVPSQEAGTEEDPFTISSEEEWNDFADKVNSAYLSGYNGKFVKLTADISVTTMAGTDGNHTFRGTFDGDHHTLTVNYDTQEEFAAPFRYTYGATIKKLKTAGTINTSNIHAGGVVGRNGTASTTLENVTSSVTINSTVSDKAYHGGLMGYAINASFTSCAFTGKLLGADSHHVGGLLGQKSDTNSSNATFTNCLFAPSEVTVSGFRSFPFAAGAHTLTTISGNCYYTTPLGGAQGTQVYAAAVADEINRQVTAIDGNTYYMPCTVSGVQDGYLYTGGNIDITAPTVTAADGTVLTLGTDYTVSTSPAQVNAEGNYTLTVSGTAPAYSGSKAFAFVVGEYTPVTSTTTAMTTGSYKVYNDATISQRITISGEVDLYLGEGTTLRARKGIELAGDNRLTIYGPGALLIDDCDANKSGIGAATAGTLTIRGGQLDITSAAGTAGIGSNNAATPTGNLTFIWTDASDYVECSSYSVENIMFSKQFVIDGEQTIATTGNIADKRIVPAVVLANTTDNSTSLAANNGKLVAAALDGRTLYKDGKWNTICLPFNVTINGSALDGATARPLNSASINGTTMSLTFGDPVDELVAGIPYIIKWANGDNITNPVFQGVTIDKTDRSYDNQASGDIRVRFLGTYAAKTFDTNDQSSILWLVGDNKLQYVKNGAHLGACRAYFKIGDGSAAARLTSFNLNFGEDDTTGVITMSDGRCKMSDVWYTINGVKLDGKPTAKGLYIVNGKKTMIK